MTLAALPRKKNCSSVSSGFQIQFISCDFTLLNVSFKISCFREEKLKKHDVSSQLVALFTLLRLCKYTDIRQ